MPFRVSIYWIGRTRLFLGAEEFRSNTDVVDYDYVRYIARSTIFISSFTIVIPSMSRRFVTQGLDEEVMSCEFGLNNKSTLKPEPRSMINS
jgi:hypothetical protein